MCPAASAKENVDARSKTCVSTVSLWTSQRATATELTLGNIKTHFSHFSQAKIFIVFNQANGNENRNCRYSMFHITNTTWSQKWCATVLMWCHVCLYQWSQAFADLAKFLTWMTDVDVSLLFSILEFFPGVSSTTYFKYSFPLGEENTYRSFRYGRRNVLQVQYLWMKPGFSHSLARHVACQSPRTHLTTKQTFPGAASH